MPGNSPRDGMLLSNFIVMARPSVGVPVCVAFLMLMKYSPKAVWNPVISPLMTTEPEYRSNLWCKFRIARKSLMLILPPPTSGTGSGNETFSCPIPLLPIAFCQPTFEFPLSILEGVVSQVREMYRGSVVCGIICSDRCATDLFS